MLKSPHPDRSWRVPNPEFDLIKVHVLPDLRAHEGPRSIIFLAPHSVMYEGARCAMSMAKQPFL